MKDAAYEKRMRIWYAFTISASLAAACLAGAACYLLWSRWDGERLSLFRLFLFFVSPLAVYGSFWPFLLLSRRRPGYGHADTGGIDRLAKWKRAFKTRPAPPRSRHEPKRYPLQPRSINGTKGDLERLVKAKPRLETHETR